MNVYGYWSNERKEKPIFFLGLIFGHWLRPIYCGCIAPLSERIFMKVDLMCVGGGGIVGMAGWLTG